MSLSGFIYVSGAIGMELVGVVFKKMGYGYAHTSYRIVLTFEESFEFIGIIIFIKSLLLYITTEYVTLKKEHKKLDVLIC